MFLFGQNMQPHESLIKKDCGDSFFLLERSHMNTTNIRQKFNQNKIVEFLFFNQKDYFTILIWILILIAIFFS